MHIQSLIVSLWSNPGNVRLIRVTVCLHGSGAMLQPSTRQHPQKPALKHHYQTCGIRSRDHDTFSISNPSKRVLISRVRVLTKKQRKKEILRQRAPCDGQVNTVAGFPSKTPGYDSVSGAMQFCKSLIHESIASVCPWSSRI